MFGQPKKNVAEVSQQKGCDREVERQVDAFVTMIPESEFSPAEIMSYLLQYREFPAAAVENCGQWVQGLLREKKIKKEALKVAIRTNVIRTRQH